MAVRISYPFCLWWSRLMYLTFIYSPSRVFFTLFLVFFFSLQLFTLNGMILYIHVHSLIHVAVFMYFCTASLIWMNSCMTAHAHSSNFFSSCPFNSSHLSFSSTDINGKFATALQSCMSKSKHYGCHTKKEI